MTVTPALVVSIRKMLPAVAVKFDVLTLVSTVSPADPPAAAIVSVSVLASVVKVILLPAEIVKVSALESAAIFDCRRRRR